MEDFNPFRFAGRIGRFRYFGYSVVWGLIIFVAAVFIATADPAGEGGLFTVGALLLNVTLLLATLSYGVRRLHDFDQSGWWYLLMLVPAVNIILGLVLLFAPGTPGPNRYGMHPGQLPT